MLDTSDPSGPADWASPVKPPRSRRTQADLARLHAAMVLTLRLPSRPTKREGNRHATGLAGNSVKLDAVPPNILRALPREVIERHLDPRQLAVTRAAKASERAFLQYLAEAIAGERP